MEFEDFIEKLKNVRRVGFLTDKDMSPERNDGQFLAAQYVLAPVALDLDNAGPEYTILDYLNPVSAEQARRNLKAVVVFKNQYNKVLVRKKP